MPSFRERLIEGTSRGARQRQKILSALQEHPGCTHPELGAWAGDILEGAVLYHLKRLEGAGLVVREGKRGTAITPAGTEALLELHTGLPPIEASDEGDLPLLLQMGTTFINPRYIGDIDVDMGQVSVTMAYVKGDGDARKVSIPLEVAGGLLAWLTDRSIDFTVPHSAQNGKKGPPDAYKDPKIDSLRVNGAEIDPESDENGYFEPQDAYPPPESTVEVDVSYVYDP